MRIIWAIDAFDDSHHLNQKMSDYIRTFYEATEADIEPIYLLRENEIILPTFDSPNWVSDHSRTAESLVREVLSDYNLPPLLPPKVIAHSSQSHGGSVEVLLKHATDTKSDQIIVGSHSRGGFPRFLLGSFAESLMSHSKIPICVIGTHTQNLDGIHTILHPTEFGEHSKKNFEFTIELAKNLKAEIALIHAIERPIESLFDLETRPRMYTYKGQLLTVEQIIEHEIENQSLRARSWVHWAQNEGVPAHFFIDSSFHDIDKFILEMSQKQKADIVLMEAQSGPLSANLLGSVTRNVMRKSQCPVVILPRHFYETKKEEERIPPPMPPF